MKLRNKMCKRKTVLFFAVVVVALFSIAVNNSIKERNLAPSDFHLDDLNENAMFV